MKKVILMSGVAFFAIVALSSCKKDHTCYCSENYSYTIQNQTKREAKKICSDQVSVGLLVVEESDCYLL